MFSDQHAVPRNLAQCHSSPPRFNDENAGGVIGQIALLRIFISSRTHTLVFGKCSTQGREYRK